MKSSSKNNDTITAKATNAGSAAVKPSVKSRPPSKLSQGPKKPYHKTYQENERRIRQELHRAIKDRDLNLTARAISRSAGITPPTFYLHCRSCTDARKRYENHLEHDFYNQVPSTAKKASVINFLSAYILRNDQYFISTMLGGDHYVLTHIIAHYRTALVGEHISHPAFVHYMVNLEAVIYCWYRYDNLSRDAMPTYVQRMMRVRPMEF